MGTIETKLHALTPILNYTLNLADTNDIRAREGLAAHHDHELQNEGVRLVIACVYPAFISPDIVQRLQISK